MKYVFSLNSFFIEFLFTVKFKLTNKNTMTQKKADTEYMLCSQNNIQHNYGKEQSNMMCY